MRPKFIILSGAYCSAEITAEFGKVPPAFLPVGLKRLFQLQLEFAIKYDADVFLTVPEDYEIDQWDQGILDSYDVTVLRSPLEVPLSHAVNFSLIQSRATEQVYLLYGDTLLGEARGAEKNFSVVGSSTEYYEWAFVDRSVDLRPVFRSRFGDGRTEREVVCGFFGFSNPSDLVELTTDSDDFISALNQYSEKYGLSLVAVKEWFDFGHLPLIYRSKRQMLASRAFNEVISDGICITKTSTQVSKIRAEVTWYQNLPVEIKPYTPQFYGDLGCDDKAGYSLEYLYQPTLAELFVFAKLPYRVWRQIISKCIEFLDTCRALRPPKGHRCLRQDYAKDFHAAVYVNKSFDRLSQFCRQRALRVDSNFMVNGWETPSIYEVCEFFVSRVSETRQEDICFWHGDFFFGNTFFDFRSKQIKVVDPRGAIKAGEHALYGDYRYDMAKLAHSVIGCYDHLLMGRAEFVQLGNREFHFKRPSSLLIEFVQNDLRTHHINGQPVISEDIMAIMGLLFLSMLPLHFDDQTRQSLMLCNMFQIYRELKERAN